MRTDLHAARCSCGGTLRLDLSAGEDAVCRRCGDEHHIDILHGLGAVLEGDIIYRWWDAGIEMDIQPLQVIRPNPKTATVRTAQGSVFRLHWENAQGFYTEDDAEEMFR